MTDDPDLLCINTIRTLSMDAVQKANSGHPGTPMGLAPVAYTLWNKRLRYDPADPVWPNRDRFVLSAGHASMLLYSLIHLARVQAADANDKLLGRPALTLDDINNFRQLGSPTPGHPEYGMTTGVETTTGPLGQGVANSVGMAIAGLWLAAHFNKPDFPLIDYNVYSICSDGDMMEGIGSEAASIAGHLRLSNLCWIYDRNAISIEGSTRLAFSEDVGTRFLAYGWNVLRVSDANDTKAFQLALQGFDEEPARPTLIIVHSHIGYGAPKKQDTAAAHGEALGEDGEETTRRGQAHTLPRRCRRRGCAGPLRRPAIERSSRSGPAPARGRWPSSVRRRRSSRTHRSPAFRRTAPGAYPGRPPVLGHGRW